MAWLSLGKKAGVGEELFSLKPREGKVRTIRADVWTQGLPGATDTLSRIAGVTVTHSIFEESIHTIQNCLTQ